MFALNQAERFNSSKAKSIQDKYISRFKSTHNIVFPSSITDRQHRKTSQNKASASLTMTGPEVLWGVPADRLNTDSLFSNMGEPVQSALHWMCLCVFIRMCACVCVFEQVHRSASSPCPKILAGWNKPRLPLTPWQRGEQCWRTSKRNFESLGFLDRDVNSCTYTPDYITLLPKVLQKRRLCRKKMHEPIRFCDVNSANW